MQLFITFLLTMLTTVVCLVYTVVVPYEVLQHKSTVETVFYLILGHYLLGNTLFNYTMAWRTQPGRPPRVR